MTTHVSNSLRIVAAVVDIRCLTLYKEDGETITIIQGDPRLRRILDEATPQLLRHGFADVLMDNAVDNSYADFEKSQTGGLVKFFRIAKAKLKALFVPDEHVEPISIGLDASPVQEPAAAHMAQTLLAVSEIMQHAVPVTSPEFTEEGVDKQANVVEECGSTPGKHVEAAGSDTIIAVVDGRIIPGMEKIKTQFSRAVKMGSTIGVETFLQRLASVSDKRSHSIEDLLKFMERGDLPIADDGSILIYKVLKRHPTNKEHFVDCHTQKVEQFVGAYVCMDVSLVDHNRSNECSNGLHVARRGYIREFSGDVCVLAKLAPEDVIAVPTYDANKMRVCGYHIIAQLTPEQYSELRNNRPLTSIESGKVLLAQAMAGQHIGKTHEVRITGQKGNGVHIKQLMHIEPVKPIPAVAEPVPMEALDNPAEETMDLPIDPKEVVAQVAQLTRKEQAQTMYLAWLDAPQIDKEDRYAALLSFKKAAKVGWDRLGIPDPTAPPVPVVKVKAKVAVKVKAAPVPVAKATVAAVVSATHSEGSPRERIQKLLDVGLDSVGVAQAVLTIKKQSKKSWTILGVDEVTVVQILKTT